jgi:hypothetical protein
VEERDARPWPGRAQREQIGEVDAVACPQAGRCVAAGVYADAAIGLQVFVTDQP